MMLSFHITSSVEALQGLEHHPRSWWWGGLEVGLEGLKLIHQELAVFWYAGSDYRQAKLELGFTCVTYH